jgi:(2Fe-2S) ferredoxin
MGRYERHIFVCLNERPSDHPRGCCALKGSAQVRDALKSELKSRGLSAAVRANNAGCLDACEHGVTIVIYPEGIWYGKVTLEDVPEIIDRTIVGGEVIQRLVIPEARYRPDHLQFPPLGGSDPGGL